MIVWSIIWTLINRGEINSLNLRVQSGIWPRIHKNTFSMLLRSVILSVAKDLDGRSDDRRQQRTMLDQRGHTRLFPFPYGKGLGVRLPRVLATLSCAKFFVSSRPESAERRDSGVHLFAAAQRTSPRARARPNDSNRSFCTPDNRIEVLCMVIPASALYCERIGIDTGSSPD